MIKKHFSKFRVKDKVLKKELVRAHSMILLLVVTLMATLALASTPDVQFDPLLAFSAIFLLAVVGLISLSVVLAVTTKRR